MGTPGKTQSKPDTSRIHPVRLKVNSLPQDYCRKAQTTPETDDGRQRAVAGGTHQATVLCSPRVCRISRLQRFRWGKPHPTFIGERGRSPYSVLRIDLDELALGQRDFAVVAEAVGVDGQVIAGPAVRRICRPACTGRWRTQVCQIGISTLTHKEDISGCAAVFYGLRLIRHAFCTGKTCWTT